MNHSFEKESTRAVPAIEYRKVFKRFERTDAKREHIRRGRRRTALPVLLHPGRRTVFMPSGT